MCRSEFKCKILKFGQQQAQNCYRFQSLSEKQISSTKSRNPLCTLKVSLILLLYGFVLWIHIYYKMQLAIECIQLFWQTNLAENWQMILLVEVECNFVKTFIVQSTLLKTSGAAEVSWPGAILAILSFYDPWNTFKIYVATFCAPVLTGKHVLMIETFFLFFSQWVEIISERPLLFSCTCVFTSN